MMMHSMCLKSVPTLSPHRTTPPGIQYDISDNVIGGLFSSTLKQRRGTLAIYYRSARCGAKKKMLSYSAAVSLTPPNNQVGGAWE